MRFAVIGSPLTAALLVPSLALAQAQPRPAARPAPQAQPQRGPQVPPAAGLLILIRTTMVAFDQANKTNVYHVFHGLGADSFRRNNTPDGFAQSFAPFRTNNVDLSPAAIISPQLSQQPAIQQGRLHLVGFFPTNPNRITFDMWFEPSQNRWKIAQMNVALTQAATASGSVGPARAAQPAQRQAQPQPRPAER